ncbi:MAG: sigma-E factor regulatory protein RseB domain-containing protein [Armatimonadota bacterium]
MLMFNVVGEAVQPDSKEITIRRPGTLVFGAVVTAALLIVVPTVLTSAQAQTSIAKRQAVQPPAPRESTTPSSDPKAVQLLRKMIQAERTRAYSAREATFGPGRQTEEAVKHDPKRGIRRESLQPPGEIIVDNYSRSWLLSTRSKTLTEGPSLAKRRQVGDAIKRLLKQKPPVERVGEETVAGRTADIVSVTANPGSRRDQVSRRFWIDRATGLRLRDEVRGPGGRMLASTYYLSVDLNPTFGPDDFTRPVPPADFKLITQDRQSYRSYDAAIKSGVSVRRPGYLPTGFRLRSIDITRKSGGKRSEQRISQRFDNGLSVLTLVQTDGFAISRRSMTTEDKKRESGFFALPRGQRVYLWRDKETKLNFALLGSLPDDELKRIADSVK